MVIIFFSVLVRSDHGDTEFTLSLWQHLFNVYTLHMALKFTPFPGTSLFSLHKIENVLSLQTANQKRAARKRKTRRKIEQRCQLHKRDESA